MDAESTGSLNCLKRTFKEDKNIKCLSLKAVCVVIRFIIVLSPTGYPGDVGLLCHIMIINVAFYKWTCLVELCELLSKLC